MSLFRKEKKDYPTKEEYLKQIENEYNNIKEERRCIIDELRYLQEDENVKRYLELKSAIENLYQRESELYEKIKFKKYSECKHILINSGFNYDIFDGDRTERYGCIKCGLDASVLNYGRENNTIKERTMYNYFMRNYFGTKNKKIDISCDIELAHSIFSKIKEAYPDIDDDTAIKYFLVALQDIRNIDVNETRKISRAKRLSLEPKFNNWG